MPDPRIYWLHALSPTHVGIGRGVGYIDLPIDRDGVTAIAERVNANVRSIGLALTDGTVPHAGEPGFDFVVNRRGEGLGANGTPGGGGEGGVFNGFIDLSSDGVVTLHWALPDALTRFDAQGGLAQHAGLGDGDEAAQQVDVQRLAHGMSSLDS